MTEPGKKTIFIHIKVKGGSYYTQGIIRLISGKSYPQDLTEFPTGFFFSLLKNWAHSFSHDISSKSSCQEGVISSRCAYENR